MLHEMSVEQEIEALKKVKSGDCYGGKFLCLRLKDVVDGMGICDFCEADALPVVKEVLTYIPGCATVEEFLFGEAEDSRVESQARAAKQKRLEIIDDMLAKRGVKS